MNHPLLKGLISCQIQLYIDYGNFLIKEWPVAKKDNPWNLSGWANRSYSHKHTSVQVFCVVVQGPRLLPFCDSAISLGFRVLCHEGRAEAVWSIFIGQASQVALVVKNLPAGAGDARGLDPWVGKMPWRRKWQLTPVFWLGEFHGQRSLAGCSPWGCKELDLTEHACLLSWTIVHHGSQSTV